MSCSSSDIELLKNTVDKTIICERDRVYFECDDNVLSILNKFTNVRFTTVTLSENRLRVIFENVNSIDFLSVLYSESPTEALNDLLGKFYDGTFTFKKNLPEAVAPFKARTSDSGYDLTLVKKIKTVNNLSYYDTGISVRPPMGFYFELVPRSSIVKSGYILANSVGIIDASYTGNIIVCLLKVDTLLPDIELPTRAVQLIPRKLHVLDFVESSTEFNTDRGDSGGLGSKNFN